MFCKKCGNELNITDVFCNKCGTKVTTHKQHQNFENEKHSVSLRTSNKVLYWIIGIAAVALFVNILALGGAFHTHKIIDEILKEPSCTLEGETKKHCSSCDYSEVITVPKLGHDWKCEKTIKEANCFDEGRATYRCITCKETEERTIAPRHSMKGRKCIYCGYTEPLPELSTGMTKSQVKAKWGEPIDIDKSVTDRGTRETWWYKDNGKTISVRFDTNGKVEMVIYS